jgi:hypothetical protein
MDCTHSWLQSDKATVYHLLRRCPHAAPSGLIVIEMNDNPNLDHAIVDEVGKGEFWMKALKWFIERFEQ